MESFSQWLMKEMPINQFNLVGNWSPNSKLYGWDKPSTGILSSEKGVQKIKNMWNKSHHNFDMYFVRKPGLNQFSETGEVSAEWVKQNIGIDINPSEEDSITVIFINNRGDEKVPMTAWTIGHRFGHAMHRGYLRTVMDDFIKHVTYHMSQILENVYNTKVPSSFGSEGFRKRESLLKAFAQAIGTMRSARTGNLRNFQEFAYELIGQYILTGAVKFRLPANKIVTQTGPFGRPANTISHQYTKDFEIQELSYDLENMANDCNEMIFSLLDGAMNRIFVM